MELWEEIKQCIWEEGACESGFFHDSFLHYENGISFCVPLSRDVISEINEAPTYTYFHHYRTVNALIDRISLKVGILLSRAGYNYYPIPASQTVNGHQSYAGSYSHKKGAVLSGLGYMGKNCLFLSNNYGSLVRLGTLFTDYPLPVRSAPSIESQCGDCDLCIQSCPAMAISSQGDLDRKGCSDYMKRAFQHIGRGSVCGICMRVCPKNKR